jgi:histidinol-phosphate aminotransferase
MIVRDLSSYKMNALRVTVGTQEQNTRFFELLDEVLNNLS